MPAKYACNRSRRLDLHDHTEKNGTFITPVICARSRSFPAILSRRERRLQRLPRFLHQFDIQTQGLQLTNQDIEAFGDARLRGRLALHDGFVDLGSSIYVIGLSRQQLLQYVGCAVGLERPHFHFAEALAAELSFTSQGLLGNQRIRPNRARMDLVVHQVRELQHINVANGYRLLEGLTAETIVELHFARTGKLGSLQLRLDVSFGGAVKDRRRESQPESLRRPAEVRLQNLSDVHAAWHAQRIQHDLHRRSVGEIRHVFFRNDAGDHALIAVPAGHLIADRQFALHRNIDFDLLDDAWGQLVTLAQLRDLLVGDFFEHRDLPRSHLLDLVHLFVQARIFILDLHALQVTRPQLLDQVAAEVGSLGEQLLVGLLVMEVRQELLTFKHGRQALGALVVENSLLVLEIAFQPVLLRFEDKLRALIQLRAFPGEDLAVHYRAFDAWRAVERRVLHVASLFAEDGAQQLLFRRQLRFAFGCDLANQDVAGLYCCPDPDDSTFIEVAQKSLGDVGNIARNFLRAELGIACVDLELLDVNRCVVIFLHQLFGHDDRILEVVPAPRHERHEHIAPQRQFAAVGARPVRQHVALLHFLALMNDGLLVDARVLVRTLELRHLVDVGAHLAPELPFLDVALDAHDDALAVD